MKRSLNRKQIINLLYNAFSEKVYDYFALTNTNPFIFLHLNKCDFDILHNFETIFGYNTSFLPWNEENDFYHINDSNSVGFCCKKCNRKISAYFPDDFESMSVLRCEDLDVDCEGVIIKKIIE